jgi:hypothetical protein
MAGGELLDPDRRHRSDLVRRQHRAGRGGVAVQQRVARSSLALCAGAGGRRRIGRFVQGLARSLSQWFVPRLVLSLVLWLVEPLMDQRADPSGPPVHRTGRSKRQHGGVTGSQPGLDAGGQSDRFTAPGDQRDLLTGQGSATQLDHHVSVADLRRPASWTELPGPVPPDRSRAVPGNPVADESVTPVRPVTRVSASSVVVG